MFSRENKSSLLTCPLLTPSYFNEDQVDNQFLVRYWIQKDFSGSHRYTNVLLETFDITH